MSPDRHKPDIHINQKHIEYCRDMVRSDDRERYECALFAPKHVQLGLWALYAFNQEIAKTRENVSEPALGEIRLQWWRDVLDEIRAGQVRDHPVVQAMAATLNEADILKRLEALIEAREQDLYDEGPADQPALEAYARAVGGMLAQTALAVSLKDTPDQALLDRAETLGSAWAMLGLVRAIPFHWASNRNYVPGDKGLASLATTDADKMFELAGPSIEAMVTYSRNALQHLRSGKEAVPADARHVFLCSAQLGLHLKTFEAAGNNPFKALSPNSFQRLRALFWAMLTGRY